jgi:hypothetical protein
VSIGYGKTIAVLVSQEDKKEGIGSIIASHADCLSDYPMIIGALIE